MKTISFPVIALSVLFVFACNDKQNSEASQQQTIQLLSTADTVYYPNGNIKEISETQAGIKHGRFIQFTEKGDTLMLGQYEKGKKEGTWMKYGGETVVFYYPEKTDSIVALPPEEKEITEFFYKHDTLFKEIEKTWYLNSAQLSTETITYYDKDTIKDIFAWHENGFPSKVAHTFNFLSNDTSRDWREDGTLVYEGLDKMGSTIYMKEFDATGKKVISTKVMNNKGQLVEKK